MPGPIKRRRKRACDLCFAKRIKCDQREPECSNCKLYHRECRRSTDRSKKDLPAVRYAADGPLSGASVNVTAPSSTASCEPIGTPQEQPLNYASQSSSPWTFNIVSPTLYYGPSDTPLWLPPIDELIPLIDYYFQSINPSLPLFSQPSFMRSLSTFISSPSDRVTWSSILVVTALSLQSERHSHLAPHKRKAWIDYCMRNAQSILTELTARQGDLLGLQVIGALALLFRSAVDVRPASMLVGIALRMASHMQLYSQQTAQHFSDDEQQQRADVFWVMYILDMNISLRLRAPPTLSNVYIDIPKPSGQSSIVCTKDDDAHLNIFLERVKLAGIETQVYDLLYSTRSSLLAPPQRQRAITYVETLLEAWYDSIPPSFKPENAPSTVREEDLIQVTNMYHVYLFCQICTRDTWSEHAAWAQQMGSLSRAAMQDIIVATQGPKVILCMPRQDKPAMNSWERCVSACREVVKLFLTTLRISGLTPEGVCARANADVILLANILLDPTQDPETTAHDYQLVTKSRGVYNRLFHGYYSNVHKSLNIIFDDLHKLATQSIAARTIQPEYTMLPSENPALCLDSALLDFDESLLEFDGQGSDFVISDGFAPDILVGESETCFGFC